MEFSKGVVSMRFRVLKHRPLAFVWLMILRREIEAPSFGATNEGGRCSLIHRQGPVALQGVDGNVGTPGQVSCCGEAWGILCLATGTCPLVSLCSPRPMEIHVEVHS